MRLAQWALQHRNGKMGACNCRVQYGAELSDLLPAESALVGDARSRRPRMTRRGTAGERSVGLDRHPRG
jgi:hypothetical protein